MATSNPYRAGDADNLHVSPIAPGCRSLIALPWPDEPDDDADDWPLTPLQRLAVVLFASAIIAAGSIAALIVVVVVP